ncbi:MAG: hypothetical protein ACYC3S_11140 [Chloroflexota bacterium]
MYQYLPRAALAELAGFTHPPVERATVYLDASVENVASKLRGCFPASLPNEWWSTSFGQGTLVLKVLGGHYFHDLDTEYGNTLTVTAYYYWAEEDNAPKGEVVGDAISLRLNRLRPERSELIAEWWNLKELQQFMARLFNYLAACWPELDGQVKPLVTYLAGPAVGGTITLQAPSDRIDQGINYSLRDIGAGFRREQVAGGAAVYRLEPAGLAPLSELRLWPVGADTTALSWHSTPGATSDGAEKAVGELLSLLKRPMMPLHDEASDTAHFTGRKSSSNTSETSEIGNMPEHERLKERTGTEQGPTEKTFELAQAAKRLKDKKPTMSRFTLAVELGVTTDSIRYAYKAMGWKWERADRVRAKR